MMMCFFILGQRHRAAKWSVVRYEGYALLSTALVLLHTFVNNKHRNPSNYKGQVGYYPHYTVRVELNSVRFLEWLTRNDLQ